MLFLYFDLISHLHFFLIGESKLDCGTIPYFLRLHISKLTDLRHDITMSHRLLITSATNSSKVHQK